MLVGYLVQSCRVIKVEVFEQLGSVGCRTLACGWSRDPARPCDWLARGHVTRWRAVIGQGRAAPRQLTQQAHTIF